MEVGIGDVDGLMAEVVGTDGVVFKILDGDGVVSRILELGLKVCLTKYWYEL